MVEETTGLDHLPLSLALGRQTVDMEAFHAVLGEGPALLFVQDTDLRYLWATAGTGIDGRSAVGRCDHDGPRTPDLDQLIAAKRRVLTTGAPERLSFRSHLPGPERLFDCRLAPLRDGRGRILGLVGAAVDITRERSTEKALDRTERKLSLVLRAAPVVLFTQDRELRYTWIFNAQGDLDDHVFIGRTDRELAPEADWDAALAFRRRVIETGKAERATFRIRLPREAQDRWFDTICEPIWEADEIVGLSGIAIDVTADVTHQRELEVARAAAIEANLAKSRFLAAASHDLRQPFQAMRIFLYLLETKLTDPAQIDLAVKLGEALDGGESLLNALLELSSLEAATVTPSLTEVPVGRTLERLAREFEPLAAAKGLRLRLVAPEATVVTDPVLLDRMLRNLLSNAIRHTKQGSVLLGARRRGSAWAVQVWDTGPGIPSDKLDAIFEEFVQLRDGPRDRRQGLGLGLAIVRRMSQLLDHPVDVVARQGRGSRFTVLVPTVGGSRPPPSGDPGPEPRGDTARLPDPEARPGSNGTGNSGDGPSTAATGMAGGGSGQPAAAPDRPLVAVAEDDRLQLAALEAMLLEWGYTPIIGGSRDELVRRLEEAARPPALIVTDYRLPDGVTGPDLARTVREKFGSSIPGLMLTGDNHADTEAMAASAGLVVVYKPVHPKRLRQAVEKAVAGWAAPE